MEPKSLLGPFEFKVLTAVLELEQEKNAYGVTIRQTVEREAGKTISIGAIYTTLNRLEEKGFVSSYEGEPLPERGGRSKRYYKIEGAGMTALNEAQLDRQRDSEWIGKLRLAGGTI